MTVLEHKYESPINQVDSLSPDERTFIFYAPQLWNKLNEVLKYAEIVTSLKSGLKTFLIITL